jgi:acyl carrier protein
VSEQTVGRPMSKIKLTIVDQMQRIAREHDKTLAPLSDDLVLLESGLDSLGFAVLVARLEDTLGIDPFTTAEDATFPVTFGDFVKVYENGARRANAA